MRPQFKPKAMVFVAGCELDSFFSNSGIDSEGHAANFVETEQIVHYNGSKASFVQVNSVAYQN